MTSTGAHGSGAAITTVRVTEDDWRLLRSVRLAALAEAPDAFGSSHAEEASFVEGDWREWIRDWATFLAVRGDQAVGLAAGLATDDPGERRLIAMWVDPEHRCHAVAASLVDAVRRWARDDGAARLSLWVTRTNEPATRLYRRLGFTAMGRSKPLASNPLLVEDQLVTDLG